jgi:hypothetical protein
MMDLSALTTLVNLLALAASVWLGFYIVTRSPRSHLSWLAALVLWSLSTFFISDSQAINSPSSALSWMRDLVVLIPPLLLHLGLDLVSAGASPPRHRPSVTVTRIGVILAYLYFVSLVVIGIISPRLFLDASTRPPILTSDRTPGPFYPIFILGLIAVSPVTLYTFLHGRRHAYTAPLSQQFTILSIAVLVSGVSALYITLGTWLHLDLPTWPANAALGFSVVLIGYLVAKQNALIEGRRVGRDFSYTALSVGLLTAFYVLTNLILYLGNAISFLTLLLTIVGALAFNSLYDGVRVALDRLFYQGQFQQLRANLRAFAREAGTGETIPEQLQSILTSVCRVMRIRKGFIALREETGFVVTATFESIPIGKVFPLSTLTASEIIGLVRPERKDLAGMALLFPLYGGNMQIGAVVLGEKETKQEYSEQDYEFLDDLGDLASVIHARLVQEENIRTINAMVTEYRERERGLQLQLQQLAAEQREILAAPALTAVEEELVQQVEDALRHLHDFPYLGEHALGKLRLVELQSRQKLLSSTFVDRGKVVNEIILQAIQKLRPAGTEPSGQQVPTREWHQFIVLYDTYVLDTSNRDVMSRLYISEGTFNRTRRRALRAVAKSLQEMEQETRV